ncbi:hypothetical protein FS749_002128 [Ceratobasidium sp. UAMH 11750]|nr:hypothetical protein FS749_002128 [Ceratobasidium sp. UAMH 11750]
MQGTIYSSPNGNLGKSGWQSTFIIDSVIAIAIALYGALVFLDTPKTTKACYLTPEDRELARSRISLRPKAKFDKTAVKNIFMGWRYWMFSLLFVVTSQLEAYVHSPLTREFC